MASRLIFSTIKRSGVDKLPSATWRRLINSGAPAISSEENSSTSSSPQSLRRSILGSKSPTGNAAEVLQNWVDSGQRVNISELRSISRRLIRFRRYEQALQIQKWQEAQKGLQLSAADHANTLKLVIKVQGLMAAEDYFDGLRNTASRKAACVPLLHGYVQERNIEKAEALMSKLTYLGLAITPQLFNEMMKLYMATSQFGKVPLVIEEMKRNKIPIHGLSFNLWMDACARLSGVAKAEAVYGEMLRGKDVKVGWSALSTLANIYIKADLVEKAVAALRKAESMLSKNNRFAYTFLMTQYASLNRKGDVLRLWEAVKEVDKKLTCATYICILSCLVKLGDLIEAERVFMEWESNCDKYDVRVSNALLGAYMRSGCMEKVESLHLRSLAKGGRPNSKTWEILTEGWTINAMEKGFTSLEDRYYRPSRSILVASALYFEKHGNLEDANKFFRNIQGLGLASSPVYKALLRMHLSAKRPAQDILEMMIKDKIEMDDEICALLQAFDAQSS